jgi:phosphoribosyl-dephospho-CoA transferase
MLQRHQLAWLGEAGWQQVRDAAWNAQARECIDHWSAHRLPWVVTRQRSAEKLALGLAAPLQFGRLRLAVEVPHDTVTGFGQFPFAEAIEPLLGAGVQAPWRALCGNLRALGCEAKVYGSHGWQWLAGLACVQGESDLDLLLPVSSEAAADAVCAVLASTAITSSRLDGELMFADGAGIAWREWQLWRSGRVRQMLVKRIDGAVLRSRGVPEEVGS